MAAFEVGSLPEGALDAAARFHAKVLPKIRAELAPAQGPSPDHLAIVFPLATHDHRGWRLAAVQDLARAAAPARVNGIVGDDQPAVAETLAYLESASGVTGQLLAVDGKSAETR